MATEKRNLYRLLHVQPEAPLEVIKASYRALMTTLGAHPDRGGSHEVAAALNAAYAVLSDPLRRAAYDRSLRRPARQLMARAEPAPPAVASPEPTARHQNRICPMCAAPFPMPLGRDAQCNHCGGPLTPAPGTEHGQNELLGRRRGERFARGVDAQMLVPGRAEPLTVRLRDLSLTGLSLYARQSLPVGAPFRVIAPGFDTVAYVVAVSPAGSGTTVHARLLTLRLIRTNAGTFVSTQA